ncbi:phage-related minor tail protein [Paraburkholderia unamae]|uniref:phage tail length tape measure family protein n=1 Tax=Paraburkholderia unamae TaxID=219649 RepID=UPI000DC1F7F5|nr:phage tail length tape measure family protein [Paraburkholderia unamae]RAR51687.1 phage-related minor tail protein [Paraburkholderia unamae]
MATDDRKVQLGVTVDATEARKGFNDVKDSARDMAQSVTSQGAAAGKAIDSIGNGGAASSQKVDNATRSMIQSIQRTTAAMEAGSKSSSQYYQALAQQRGIPSDALTPYLAQLDAAKAKQDAASNSMHEFSLNSTRARTELVVLGHEISQGNWSKFGGSLMVMAEATDALSIAMSPLGLGIGVVTAGIAAMGVAMYKGYAESDRLNKALASTGNYAGMTAGQVGELAESLGKISGGTTEAQKVLTGLIQTGRFSGDALEAVAKSVIAMSDATGQSADKVLDQYTKMSDGVAKWAEEQNKQYHFLTLAEYDHIKALEDMGEKSAAEKATADALTAALGGQQQQLGWLPAAWKAVGDAASSAWRQMMNLGKPTAAEDKLADLKKQLTDAQASLASGGADVTENGAVVYRSQAALQQRVTDLQNQLANQQAFVDNEQKFTAQQKINDDIHMAALDADKALGNSLTTLDKDYARQQEMSKLYQQFAALKKEYENTGVMPSKYQGVSFDVHTGNFSGGLYDKAAADITKKYTEKTPASHADETSNREVANLKAEIAAQEQQLALMDQYSGAQAKISDGDKKVLQIEQQLGLAQKDRIGKVSDAQLKEQLGYAQTLAALEKQIQAKKDAEAAQKAYNEQVDKWAQAEQSAQDALSQDLALYGTEGEQRKLLATQLKYEAEARETITKAQREGHPLSAQQQSDLMAEADARAKVVGSIVAQQDALAAATQLEKQHEQFQANSIADAQQRADALTAIEAKKWQDLIQQAGDGTEAQKKLIAAYEQWLVDQAQSYNIQQWKSLIDGIGTDFHNGFLQMLSDGEAGWKSFTKSLVNTFEVTVVNALYEAFAKKWVIQVVAEIAGVTQGESVKNALLGTNNTSGTSVTQLLGSSDQIKSLYDWATAKSAQSQATGAVLAGEDSAAGMYNLGSNVGGSASSYYASMYGAGSGNAYGFTNSGNSTSTGLFGTNFTGSDALGALGSAASGYGIGKVIGGTTGSEVGGSVGALAGSLAIPIPVLGTVIGGVVGSVLGKVVGGLFGGGETRYGGVYSTADGTAANTSKVGTGPSGGMNATESGTTVGNVDLTYNTIKTLAGALGGSLEGLGTYHAGWELSPSKGNSWVEAGFVQNLNDTSDRTQLSGVKDANTVATDFTLELQRSIVKSLQMANLDKPYADYLAQFNASTLTADDVTNIESELQTMKTFFDTVKALGPSFANLKNAGTSAQAAIANLAGGMDTLSSELSYYSQNFTTTQEQYATQAANVQAQLDALGEGSVKTKDQFKAVVESLDLTTGAGQSLYQSMLALAPSFETMIENEQAQAQAAQQAADAQQALWENYYGAVYTSSQQAAVAQGELKAKFDALGVAMPKTNAEFEALVENMDTSTQPMMDLQNALLSLAPAFAQMTSAVAQAEPVIGAVQKAAISTLSSSAQSLYTNKTNASSLVDTINSTITGSDADTSSQISTLWSEMTGGGVSLTQQIDLATQLNDLITKRYQTEEQAVSTLTDQIKQLRDYVQSLKTGDLSTETPSEKLADAAQQYADTLAKAQGGDQTAIGNLSSAADNYLKLAQSYYASSDTYTQIFASVTSQLSAFGDALQSQSDASGQLSQQSLDQLTQLRDIASAQASSANSQYQGVMGQLAQQLATLDALEQAAGLQSEVPSILQGLPSEIAAQLASVLGNGTATGSDQVTSLYQSMLGRTPTANEVSYWTDSFANGSKTIADFKYSADQELIGNLYQQVLGRQADAGGLQFYTDQLYSGKETLDQIKADLQKSLLDGSHAGGLDVVPWDGYRAELHKGEAVITSANNQKLSQLLNIDWSQYGRSANADVVSRLDRMESAVVQATQQSAAAIAAATARSAETISDSTTKAAEINLRTTSAKPALV